MPRAGRITGAQADQWWKDAIRRVAAEETDGPDGKKIRKLRLVATKLFEAALDGDVVAMKEIGDRLDGRPRQQVNHGGDEKNPIRVQHETDAITKIEALLGSKPS